MKLLRMILKVNSSWILLNVNRCGSKMYLIKAWLMILWLMYFMTCIQCTIHPETSTRKLDPCSFPKQRWSDWDVWSDLFCGHVCHLEKWNAGFRLRGDYWKMTFGNGFRWRSERRPKLVCHWSCFWWCKGVVFGRLQNGYQDASGEMSEWQIQTLVETPNGDTPPFEDDFPFPKAGYVSFLGTGPVDKLQDPCRYLLQARNLTLYNDVSHRTHTGCRLVLEIDLTRTVMM